jgi:sortase B
MVKKILLIVLVLVFAYSTTMVGYRLIDKYRNDKLYENMTTVYKENSVEQNLNNSIKEDEQQQKEQKQVSEKTQQLQQSLLKVNPDVVGWITIENSKINYPVVQAKDNEYYLKNNFENQYSKHGSIFVDYRNENLLDFWNAEKNIVIYGHNLRDGTMFNDLELYKEENYFNSNQMISFDIFPHQYKWQAFSAYVTDTDFDYIQTDFKNDTEYSNFIKSISEKSWYKTDTIPDSNDIILTLSTCSYEFEDARFVVHYKLIH